MKLNRSVSIAGVFPANESYTRNQTTKQSLSALILLLMFFLLFLSQILHAQTTLMGLTSNGGADGRGTAFTIGTNGSAFTITRSFPDWGRNPNGGLIKGADGSYYGMSFSGGTYNNGTIFKITPTGVLTVIKNFNALTDGGSPYGSLTAGKDGNFYGLTSSGGTNSYGTIFKLTASGTFTVLRHLGYAADGANPQGTLALAADGTLFGITRRGGSTGYGTIFKITTAGTFTVIRHLNNTTDGGACYGSLSASVDGNFYGITSTGGTNNNGTIFKVTATGTLTVLRHLKTSTDGSSNTNSLVDGGDGFLYGVLYYGGTNGLGTIFKISKTGTFSVLRHLNHTTDGSSPRASLIVGTDGHLYGTNSAGGANGGGTIFRITKTGTFTLLRSLTVATDGGKPAGELFKGTDGAYYGMTNTGGSNLYGTIFKITASGTYSVLTRLNGGIIGNSPVESVAQASNHTIYGTTQYGGVNDQGTIFKICGGVYSVLYSFNSGTTGGQPKGSLLVASDGNIYGTCSVGGNSNAGTIFKITPSGSFTVLKHLLGSSDGSAPQGSLLQGADGFLYGMNSAGGTGAAGTIFKISTSGAYKVIRHLVLSTDGSNPEGALVPGAGGADSFYFGVTKSKIFKISPNGKIFTVLKTLNTTTEGNLPVGSLLRGSDGNYYGTTSAGGNFSNAGTIFKITPTGTYSVIRHLNPSTDGGNPTGSLVQAADGFLYGLTSTGGTYKSGTIFKVSTAGSFSVIRQLNLIKDGGNPYGSLIILMPNALVANPQNLTTTEDVAKAIVLTGSGGSPLTFNIVTPPRNGTVSTGTTASRTYTPAANYAGKDSFYFTSNIGCQASVPAKVLITISAVNDAPVLATIGNKTAKQGALLSFTASATDPDAGQTKTFSLISPPAGATINGTTGIFNWTPATLGTFTFKVRVTDNGTPALYDEEQITVNVTTTGTIAIDNKAMETALQGNSPGLYPNPVVDEFVVTFDQPAVNRASITNMQGAIIRSFGQIKIKGNSIRLNARGLKPGTYLLQLDGENHRTTYRFVKL